MKTKMIAAVLLAVAAGMVASLAAAAAGTLSVSGLVVTALVTVSLIPVCGCAARIITEKEADNSHE